MPVVTKTEVPGHVSCRDPRCLGFKERETTVEVQKQEFSYRELGGDLPGNEREAVDVVQGDEMCEHCGKPQVWYVEPRTEYAQISGQDQLALLNLNQSGQIQDAQRAGLEQAKELAELKARAAERDLRDAERDRLFADMAEELKRRRGGRPPKDDNAA